MSTTIVCMASPKGGSGKTITSANLAALLTGLRKQVPPKELAEGPDRQKMVLLMDCDIATNGMTLLYLDKVVEARKKSSGGARAGLFDANGDPTACPITDSVWLVPATYVMKDTQRIEEEDFSRNLDNAIKKYREHFKYIFLDAQAGRDSYAVAAMSRADKVVIVSEYDPISAKGVERLKTLIADEVSFEKLYVLFNKVLPELVEKTGDFLSVTNYLPPIPWSADVVRAFVRGKLPVDMENGNLFTVGLLATAGVLLGDEITRAGEEWKAGVASSMRQPFQDQLREVEAEIQAALRTRIDAQFEIEKLSPGSFERVGMMFLRTFAAAVGIGGVVYIVGDSFGLAVNTLLLVQSVVGGIVAASLALWIRELRWRRTREKRQKETLLLVVELDRSLRHLEEKQEQLRAYVSSDVDKLVGSSR